MVGSCRIGETVAAQFPSAAGGAPTAAARGGELRSPRDLPHRTTTATARPTSGSSTECVATGDECCGDGIDDNCDTRTDEFGCTPHGACPPGSSRSCSTGDEWGWGYQFCPVSGLAWEPCFADAAPSGCPSSPVPGWDPVCCMNAGFCCQDTADADGDGYTSDSVGLPGACPPESN